MVETPNVYIFSDQPTTCPKCGARTDIVFDSQKPPEYTQIHVCLSPYCNYEFVMEEDISIHSN